VIRGYIPKGYSLLLLYPAVLLLKTVGQSVFSLVYLYYLYHS